MFLYALGREHAYRDPCRAILERCKRGELVGEASVELVHEFAHVRLRRHGDRAAALREAAAVADLCTLHDFERRDLPVAFSLLAEHDRLDPRDAIFAATALNRGIEAILSPDRDWDAIAGLARVDPGDAAAIDEIAQG